MIDKEKKKFFIEQLLSINNMLDTYRTNLNILIYNIYSNDRLTTLPAVNFDEMKKNCILFSNLLNGTLKDYWSVREKENIQIASTINKNAFAKNIIDSTDKLKKQDAKEFKERNDK